MTSVPLHEGRKDQNVRSRFASDLDNLTLATPAFNRYDKSGKDASE